MGSYTVDFDGSDLAPGFYTCKLMAGDYTKTKHMVLTQE
jgi:hypothetical protein